MKLTVIREPSQGGATIGKMFIDGVFACFTLEDEVREVEGQPVSEWKIKGATAIPAGSYRVTLEHSARFGPDTPTINDVPGFQYIRMHAGNTAADTEGCLLLGLFASKTTLLLSAAFGVGGGAQRVLLILIAKFGTPPATSGGANP
jgi:hypothetical protein